MELYQGDCLELMKGIPDGSVDMVLCDLPYGTTGSKWDSVVDSRNRIPEVFSIVFACMNVTHTRGITGGE